MFFGDSGDFEEEIPGQIDETQVEKLIEGIEARSQKIGLYMKSAKAFRTPEDDRTIIVATFTLGDIAFSPRVQDPEQAKVDEQFRDLKDGLEDAEYEEMRERWRRGDYDLTDEGE